MRYALTLLVFPLSLVLAGTGDVFAEKLKNKIEVKELENRGEIDAIKCDATNEAQMRVGEDYTFDISFTAKQAKYKVSNVNYWFWTDTNYDATDKPIVFESTKEALDSGGVVENGTLTLMKSDSYVIRIPPEKRSKENIIVKYEILFNEIIPGTGLSSEQGRLVQCGRYMVTRCGDGVVDKKFGETCDDGPNGSATCSKECKRISH